MSQVTVTITNGNPSPDPVSLQSGDTLVFSNQDSKPHLIELWTRSQTCIKIGIYLAANGNIALMPDPNDLNATVYYNVLTPGVATNPSSGGHGIIIGSGVPAATGEAA